MKIATWNVNSVRARLPRLIPWINENRPDVLCLQETKVVDDLFPREHLEDCGYNIVVFGQKAYNGVAILARHDIEDVVRGFDGDGNDAEKRAIGCIVRDYMILDLYVPNGSEVGSDKFRAKLGWLDRLRRFLDERYDPAEKIVVTGDFNITFDDRDVWDPDGQREALHCSTAERAALAEVMEFGLHDGMRKHHEDAGIYTWWDLRAGAFHKNQGMRIDHFLMSESAVEASEDVVVDRDARKGKGPSDHAPVIATFA
jgi:exodeoxyribonuclease-3